jgi:DNA-directed RNA polymerase subunit RPC12/RpoP
MASYTVKHTGKAALRSFNFMCPKCSYEEERSVDMRNSEEEIQRDMLIKCPNCDHEHLEQVIRHAPSVGMGDPKSDKNLAKMQKNLRERFIKKEIDDVRHKHGRLYDDAVRSSAAQRIKSEEDAK